MTILVATGEGCRVLGESGERAVELQGRQVSVLAAEPGGSCLAVVDEPGSWTGAIWRRLAAGEWLPVGDAGIPVQSLASAGGVGRPIYAGGLEEAAVVRIAANGEATRLIGFDITPGRESWFASGPPLGVRSLATTADGAAILAAVHVGGVPRSVDGGESWSPTMPVNFDVHEVSASPSLPNLVMAATAVGLCVSENAGLNWRTMSQGLEETNSLAVAIGNEEALFSIQEGPFASRSQLWRSRLGSDRVEQVREGLPEWLDGKVDTAHIAAGYGRFAVVDGGGSLWVSTTRSIGWERRCSGLGYVFGVVIV